MGTVRRVFEVDGRPFFPLGGQAKNSSGYNRAEAETAFRAVQQLHGNTVEIPVYWEQIEPSEGAFCFDGVADLLALAAEYQMKLVLLWFASWKNGDMDYAPDWVKQDTQRFRRVINPLGVPIWGLSPYCAANREADAHAFRALMAYLRDHDTGRAVIAIQVQNEPGTLWSDRDYSPEAEEVFQSPVPPALVRAIAERPSSPVHATWQACGAHESGNWPALFGAHAGEYLNAFTICQYIDSIAGEGKAVYDLPMYVNVWLAEQRFRLAGDYPSGGAVSAVLDIWLTSMEHLDLVAPDIYLPYTSGFRQICANYARDGNPLFVPESGSMGPNAWQMMYAIGEFDAIGYACFGVEHILEADGSIKPAAQQAVESFRAVSEAIPLLLRYQGSGRVHAIVQEENQGEQYLDLDGWIGVATFGYGTAGYVGRDWRHSGSGPRRVLDPTLPRGRGLLFQADDNTFYLVGAAYQLHLCPKDSWAAMTSYTGLRDFHLDRQGHWLSVDEGHFDEAGSFVVDRRRNGDEIDHGAWVEADVRVVRVRMGAR
ncbi:MAG: DUF5597 domain-containing protein [Anaerolineae bacterium]|jgi:hypothetical protein|nr:DUF5597 domain-containing protein [Chloroflexota bacterium]